MRSGRCKINGGKFLSEKIWMEYHHRYKIDKDATSCVSTHGGVDKTNSSCLFSQIGFTKMILVAQLQNDLKLFSYHLSTNHFQQELYFPGVLPRYYPGDYPGDLRFFANWITKFRDADHHLKQIAFDQLRVFAAITVGPVGISGQNRFAVSFSRGWLLFILDLGYCFQSASHSDHHHERRRSSTRAFNF